MISFLSTTQRERERESERPTIKEPNRDEPGLWWAMGNTNRQRAGGLQRKVRTAVVLAHLYLHVLTSGFRYVHMDDKLLSHCPNFPLLWVSMHLPAQALYDFATSPASLHTISTCVPFDCCWGLMGVTGEIASSTTIFHLILFDDKYCVFFFFNDWFAWLFLFMGPFCYT